MAKLKDLQKAFDIFRKYDPDVSLGGADHDIIYGPSLYKVEEWGMSDEDKKKLDDLGWMEDPEYDCWTRFV